MLNIEYQEPRWVQRNYPDVMPTSDGVLFFFNEKLPNAGDHIYVIGNSDLRNIRSNRNHHIKIQNGHNEVYAEQSNSTSLYEQTGIDFRERHLTYVEIGKRCESNTRLISDHVYRDAEWCLGSIDRGRILAERVGNRLGNSLHWDIRMIGGRMTGSTNPVTTVSFDWNEGFLRDLIRTPCVDEGCLIKPMSTHNLAQLRDEFIAQTVQLFISVSAVGMSYLPFERDNVSLDWWQSFVGLLDAVFNRACWQNNYGHTIFFSHEAPYKVFELISPQAGLDARELYDDLLAQYKEIRTPHFRNLQPTPYPVFGLSQICRQLRHKARTIRWNRVLTSCGICRLTDTLLGNASEKQQLAGTLCPDHEKCVADPRTDTMQLLTSCIEQKKEFLYVFDTITL